LVLGCGSLVLRARLNPVSRLLSVVSSGIVLTVEGELARVVVELHVVAALVVEIERVVDVAPVLGHLAQVRIQLKVVLAFVIDDNWLRRIQAKHVV